MAHRIATCEMCGSSWEHPGQRGRLPKRCEACHRDYWNDWQRDKHREIYRRPCRVAKCDTCGRFIKIVNGPGRLPERCLSCEKGYRRGRAAALREANPAASRLRWQRFKARHPERVRANASLQRASRQSAPSFLVTPADIARILAQPCAYCDAPSEHIDHVIPLSRGGRHSIGNLTGACAKCNQSKSNKLLIEWRLQRKEQAA